ncbi:kinetochore Sim4 complex subunit Fta4 [Glomus cerebriforme]|uniref:Kinetochore Sim4 complex subunit Fta4 n=1 Tax=Glomus cerebriforme TaxID=658196 RepID=A0A397T938_9GLOM|nr:kinetochore Sim4 complex subunit Fta4 [Glomus cerebriforme]
MEQSYYNRRQAFIESQIKLIEQEFTPSERWLSKAEKAKDKIPLSVIDSVLTKLNMNNRKQHKQTFNRQSIRQILEQLQYLWDQKRKDALEGRVRVESKENFDDLRWIESFPEEWPHTPNCELDDEQLERYAQLRSHVYKIQKEYIAIKEKSDHYKSLQNLVEPLDKSDIQQHVITKNAPVVNEIKRMRILLPKLLRTLEKRSDFLNKRQEGNLLSKSKYILIY